MTDLPVRCPDSHWKRRARSCSLPSRIRSSWRRLLPLLMLSLALTGCASRDLLRQVTTGLCLPNARLTGLAAPCRQVVADPGFAMLRAPDGATIEEIMAATGWQSHTVRGAMAGALKKKLGLEVTSERVENRGRVYKLPAA